MSIGLHIIQKLNKRLLLQQITPNILQQKVPQRKEILGNNSNIRQKNDLYLPEISLRNTIRKPSHPAHGQINNNNNNNNNNLTAILRAETSSVTKCNNEISRNLRKYFQVTPQITIHALHCNLVMVTFKAKHASTLLKQRNYFNYSVVMSDCLFLFVFPHLTICSAVHLTNCYLSCYAESFVNVSHVSNGRNHITF
jgi:hypothetical protein